MIALAVAVVAYCAVTFALFGDDVERGAYLIPLAFPAAVLTARSIPPWRDQSEDILSSRRPPLSCNSRAGHRILAENPKKRVTRRK